MKKLSQDALAILSDLEPKATIGHGYKINKIEKQLDRTLYVEVDAALKEIGGTWKRQAQAHIFDSDPTAKLEEMILTGAYTSKRKDFGFFETPPALARKLVAAADIQPGMRVLEPSAGRGALIRTIVEAQPTAQIWAIELNSDLFRAVNELHITEHVVLGDFINWKPPVGIEFDRVVMNPPFNGFADPDHVLHAYSMLRSNGLLVSIMSASWTFRDNSKAKRFRRLVEECGKWEKLPEGSFEASGTSVNTTMVLLRKP